MVPLQLIFSTTALGQTWFWAWYRAEDLRWVELVTGVTCFVVQFEARFRLCDFGVPPVFRNANVQKLQTDRLKKLAAGNETTGMGKQILPWMQLHPRSAEGLAILEKLVEISRYGVRDTATPRQAFILLHKHSPNGLEAIRTNYFH